VISDIRLETLDYEHHYSTLFLNQAQATIRRRGCCIKAVVYLNVICEIPVVTHLNPSTFICAHAANVATFFSQF